MKSGSLKLLEPSGPHRACYGTPLPLLLLHSHPSSPDSLIYLLLSAFRHSDNMNVLCEHICSICLVPSSFDVGIGTRLRNEWWGVRIPVEARNFSPFWNVQTRSGTYSASSSIGTGCSFPRVKRPGREANQSPPSCNDVNERNFTSIPSARLHVLDSENVTLTLRNTRRKSPRQQTIPFFLGLSSPLCSKLMVGRVITVNNTTRSF